MRLSRRHGVIFTTLLFALGLAAAASGPAAAGQIEAPFSAAPYRVGERLTYNVSFSSFPTAAHVRLEVAGRGQFYGREGVELRAHVETLGVVNAALYAVNNDYVTFVDPATGLPYRSLQSIREGARTEELSSDFNDPGGVSAIPPKQTAGALPGSFDLISALYRARALPLAPGAVYPLAVRNGTTIYSAELRVTGRETVKTNVGTTNAVAVQVRVPSDKTIEAQRLRIYFTDDERHVPVLITVRHPAGEIRAELASAEFVAQPEAAPGVAAPAQPGNVVPPVAPTPVPGTAPPTAAVPRPAPATPTGADDLPFKPGDQLNYNFYLGPSPQPIGTASLQVRARAQYYNRDGFLFTGVIQTTGSGQALFPVNDQFNSYVDARTLMPFRTELNLREGNRQESFVISFDQNGATALFADGTRVEIPVNTHDLLSVFFALRSFDLTPPKTTSVSLLVNKRPRLLTVTALRRGTVVLGTESIEAVEVALATNDPNGDRFGLRLWVSTDRRKLPLRMTAQTPFGPLRADLAIIPTRLQ
ncbi:MAG TPA: DUF3108 domain-containing protein [Pyrinomonadaceae bacterium]|nr:DUF3108 domain-containing protein [Pyrinomonadaceae bacterium]